MAAQRAGATADAPLTPSAGAEKRFVHLHLHSEYSLLDGGNRIDRLLDRVKELGMHAVGLTDHGNLFGAVAFYTAAKERGIKPILGVEAYVTPPGKERTDRTYAGGGEGGFHLVLLCQSDAGWRNLVYLASEAYLTGFYYKPRIDRALLSQHSEGLIAINGHLGSEIGDHLLAFERTSDEKYWKLAVESATWHAATFPGRFYIELQHHVPEQIAINPHLVRLARELDLPLVADNDAHFLREEDHDAHDTLICISTGKAKSEPNRMRYPPQVFVKSPEQMLALAEEMESAAVKAAWIQACQNTVKIADSCEVALPLGVNRAPTVRVRVPAKGELPAHDEPRFGGDLTAWYKAYCERFEVLPMPPDASAAELDTARADCQIALRMLAAGGVVWRYGPEPARPDESEKQRRADIDARLQRELKILCDKGIAAYFLIVWDFVNWGRTNGVPALARGSGVGTMVGYVLGLSNACPVRYGLLFERFTDPDRSEYPDIDIDLCQDGRGRVIEHVRSKYGHVAQIITFGTLKARAAVRDVGRVLELTLPEVDKIAKLIPETLGMTLDEALEQEPDLRALYDSDERVQRLIDNARTLEGQARHASVHAAGVIVATRPLHEVVPLYKPTGSEDGAVEVVTQWDGPTCEKMGLLKMDFLGLRTISVIERCKELIRRTLSEEEVWRAVGRGEEFKNRDNTAGAVNHPLDLDRLTFDDPRVFALFQRGETTGVFQFESGGMRRLLVEMKPDRLEDLIAANALFRPGPMDLIPDYNRRKHGQDVVPSVHPVVDQYTAETYGVMVYQEQVMQIVHGLGGIKLRDAYTLIKNISKKKHDKIEKERPKFVEGAVKQGLTKPEAEHLFELILKFAGYGFNKSHSTGYAIVAYQTAYLKTYFPNQYMAAFLSYESSAMQVKDWVPYLEDCKKTRFLDGKVGVEVRPPDINLSQEDFTVVYEPGEPRDALHGHVRFGLKAIKGVGDKAIDAIVRERRGVESQEKPFTSLFDFCERVLGVSTVGGSGGAVLTRATLEALIKCGAMDCLHGRENRAAMLATVEAALSAGQKAAQDKASGQHALFGGEAPAAAPGKKGSAAAPAAAGLARVSAFTEAEALEKEKDVLGFYVSSHPLDEWAAWVQAFLPSRVGELRDRQAAGAAPATRERVLLAGLVQSVRLTMVKNGASAGQKMAILQVDDRSGVIECVVFADAYAKFGHLAVEGSKVFVLGELDMSRAEPQIKVDRIMPIECAPRHPLRYLDVLIDGVRLNGTAEPTLAAAHTVLLRAATNPPAPAPAVKPSAALQAAEPGSDVVSVRVFVGIDGAPRAVPIPMAPGWKVAATPVLLKTLGGILGDGCFRLSGQLVASPRDERRNGKWTPRSQE